MQKILHRLKNIKKSKYQMIIISLLSLILLLNIAACSQTFCNGYTNTVYGTISDFLGRITNFLPMAAGELIMYLFAVSLLLSVLFSILLVFLRKKQGFFHFTFLYLKTVLLIFLLGLFLYTTHWVIPFRSSLLGESGHYEKQYTRKELRCIWLYVVGNLNKTCAEAERDENGLLLYPPKETIERKTAAAMKKISEKYPRLQGFYPSIKPALCSDVLRWMDIGGYTYPYTMEVTYNKYISDLYFPTLYAHESAHHQGYYQENEANFLSYLSCSGSDDPILRYSAYHTIYYYINNAYLSAISGADADTALLKEYKKITVSEQVRLDEKAERKKTEQTYASDSHPLEHYSEIAEDAADVGWSTQGDLLAENSYDGVVQLLLEYYDGILY